MYFNQNTNKSWNVGSEEGEGDCLCSQVSSREEDRELSLGGSRLVSSGREYKAGQGSGGLSQSSGSHLISTGILDTPLLSYSNNFMFRTETEYPARCPVISSW